MVNNTMYRECSDKGIPCFCTLEISINIWYNTIDYSILSLNTQTNGETDW